MRKISQRISMILNGLHRVIYFEIDESYQRSVFCSDNNTLYVSTYLYMSVLNAPTGAKGDMVRMIINQADKKTVEELLEPPF